MNKLWNGASVAILSLASLPAYAGPPVAVPEPGTMALLAGAVAAAVIVGRIRKKK
jgi:hypothetical protein